MATLSHRSDWKSQIPLSDTIDIHIVPILDDNFSYLIHDKTTSTAALVDPAEPNKLLDVAKRLNATVTSSLTTHHHYDHAGGNLELARLIPGIEIVGSAYEQSPGVTLTLHANDLYTLAGTSVKVTALHTPCHTVGHLCFSTITEQPAVFSGDTLFVGGCGKFFEGTALDMQTSLNETLAALPDSTLLFCGHEYTASNLRFARSIEPDNEQLKEKLEWSNHRLRNGLHTIPSTIGDEKKFNPFMRTDVETVVKAVGESADDPVAVMAALRKMKNSFRG